MRPKRRRIGARNKRIRATMPPQISSGRNSEKCRKKDPARPLNKRAPRKIQRSGFLKGMSVDV